MARPAKTLTTRRKIVQGSEDHKVLLGIETQTDPQKRADLEAALKTVPIVIATDKDIPWVSRRGDRLPGGWVRRGE